MSTPTAGILEIPTAPVKPAATAILYMLYFRQGNNPHPQMVFFHHQSKDMKVITERAKRHCEVMNYRFTYVRPAIIDLDREENIFFQRDSG